MDDPYVPTRAEVEAMHGRSTALRVQLCVSVDESYARALTVCRQWFEDGFARLGGAFHQAALTSPLADIDVATRLSRRVPGAMSVRLLSMLGEDSPDDYVTYSPEAWQDMLLSLGRVPWLASVDCAANGNDGDPEPKTYFYIVAGRVDSGGCTWLHLSVGGSQELFMPGPRQAVMLDFLRRAAERGNPVHGEISWGNTFMLGLYEEAIGSHPSDTLPAGRRALRGYAWVTILPEEIGIRLGGVDALRDGGAFVEVEHLGAGGFWCRATPTLEDYDEAAAERVFDVVASALPPGRPSMWRVIPPNVLSPCDPADY